MIDSFFADKLNSLDNLTRIYTRDVIIEYVNFLIGKNVPFSLALVDIDNFKYVNDTFGHIVGDTVIKTVANTLKNAIDKIGVVGRFGGDEFIIVFPEIVEYDAAWTSCRTLAAAMANLTIQEQKDLNITVTTGLARFPENEKSYEKLLETADKALYRGKMKGRDCFIIYLPEKHAKIVLKTEKDKTLSPMYLHAVVFRNLTKPSLSDGIESLFNFFRSYFMLDHICIQTGNDIFFQKIHELSKVKSFKPVDLSFINQNIMSITDMYYLNRIDQLDKLGQIDFKNALDEQGIHSTFYARIICNDRDFGFIRADSTHQRVWQYADMDILLTAARTIALILNERNIDFYKLSS
ncbi:MAG: GGDEF domain-containing protein [Treponema sp.]|nr:GGDEF domain-containing protein [Treponema sp.]